MDTKKVYVIDKSCDFSYIEKLREILGCSEDTEIICVQSPEQIPFEVRLKEEILKDEGTKHESLIEEINEIKALPRMEELCRIKPTCKGHERPYKYHR